MEIEKYVKSINVPQSYYHVYCYVIEHNRLLFKMFFL